MIGNKAIICLSLLTLGAASASAFSKGKTEITSPGRSLSFVENKGQWDGRAAFYSGLPGMDVWITADGLVYKVYRDATPKPTADGKWASRFRRESHAFQMEFVGANPQPSMRGINAQPGVYNYIRREGTYNDVRRYDEARMENVYPGIDARVYHDQGTARFDFVVQPGADPNQISTRFGGADGVRVISQTRLGVKTRFGEIPIDGLFAYQQYGNQRKRVAAEFVMQDGLVKFRLGTYDRSRPLVIDPLVYGTLLGAPGDDQGLDVVADNLGFAFICGATFAPTFPTSFGAFDEFIAATDAFVTKFSTDAVDIIWSTFVGGAFDDVATAIDIDDDGNAYITGITRSNDFPVSLLAPQPNNAGGQFPLDDFYPGYSDAFIFKLSPDGTAMVYGTYCGGFETGKFFRDPMDPANGPLNPQSSECATDIVVDSTGAATICGFTTANNFPVTLGALQTTFAGPFALPPIRDPGWDGFITKINSTGTAFTFSTYMGGRNADQCQGLALDDDDNIYVSGATNSTGLPTTAGVFVTTEGAFDRSVVGRDCFLLKLPPNGSTRTYATVLGGNGNDGGFFACDDGVNIGWIDFLKPNIFDPLAGFFRFFYGYVKVGVDPQGDAFVTGTSRSTNFPTTLGAFDRQYNNGVDAFLTRFFRDGTRLVYSTLIGSAGNNYPNALRIDDTGVAYIVGYSQAGGLTLPGDPNTFQPDFAGPDFPNDWFDGDGFILAFNDSGSNILWGSYIGGEEGEEAFGCALDPSRSLYIAGRTNSWTEGGKDAFPTTPDIFRTFMINDRPAPNIPPKAWSDAFLAKLHIRVPIVMDTLVIDPREVAGTQSATGTITLSGPASPGGAIIHLETSHPEIVTIPSTVFIPEGDTQITFQCDTVAVLETFITKVTASFEARTLEAALVVAPYLSALTVSNINVFGGNAITGRVTLFQAAPAGGAEVSLYSGNPLVVTMPDTVTVPEGQTTAIFDIQTMGVTQLTQVQLTAQYLGMARSQVINVLPAAFQQFLFNPTRVTGGEPSRARVVLQGAVPADTVLNITRVSGFTNVTFPAQVTVPAGSNFVEFDVQTGFVPNNGVVRLRATGPGGFIEGSLGIDHTQLLSVVLTPTDVIGGAVVSGRVNLTRPAAPSGLNVVLTNSNPTAGTIDRATVFVPPGATTSETFFIQTNSVSQTQAMTVTASKPGYISRQATLLVREPTLGLQLIITPPSVTGGYDATGTLSIQAARPDDIEFALSASSGVVGIPTSVTIPAGATQVSFPITTTLVSSDITVTITATRGSQSAVAQLQVLAPGLFSLTLTPNTVRPNQTSQALILLDQIAPSGGIRVNISSSIPSLVQHPAFIIIPSGRNFGSFNVTAKAVSRPIAVEIICQIPGSNRRVSAFLFINP